LGATTGVIYLTPEFLEPTPTAPSTPDNGRNDSSDENA
jgi:hypothetical protein